MIAYQNTLSVVEAQTVLISNHTETVWVHVELSNNITHIRVYCHASNDKSPESAEDIGRILGSFPSNPPTIIGGDFNRADIRWKLHTVAPGSDQRILWETLISIFGDHHLKQLVKEPTREENILNLCTTNCPGLVESVQTIQGFADHHIVIVDSDIKLRLSKKLQWTVFQWSQAACDTLKEKTMKFQQDFLQIYAERNVNTN